ncbi:MAG: zinc finger domain-containing protein [Candidatus Micrarchaeota archaeon]
MALKNCSSCGRQTKEYVEFLCPSCNQDAIIRCYPCRENRNKYQCKKCGFEGP